MATQRSTSISSSQLEIKSPKQIQSRQTTGTLSGFGASNPPLSPFTFTLHLQTTGRSKREPRVGMGEGGGGGVCTLRPGEISADLSSAHRSAISASAWPRVRRIWGKTGERLVWCGEEKRGELQARCRRGKPALFEAAAVVCGGGFCQLPC